MGAYLDKPVTEKMCDAQEGEGIRSYSCNMQGWRITMEVLLLEMANVCRIHMSCALILKIMRKLHSLEYLMDMGAHILLYTGIVFQIVFMASRNHLLPVLLSQPEYKGKDVYF